MQFLSAKQTLERVQQYAPWSLSSLYAKSRSGEFVAPVRLGGKLLWSASAVEAYIGERFGQEQSAPRQEAAA